MPMLLRLKGSQLNVSYNTRRSAGTLFGSSYGVTRYVCDGIRVLLRHCLCFAWYVGRRPVSWSRLRSRHKRKGATLCVRVRQQVGNDTKGMARRHWYCEARGEIL